MRLAVLERVGDRFADDAQHVQYAALVDQDVRQCRVLLPLELDARALQAASRFSAQFIEQVQQQGRWPSRVRDAGTHLLQRLAGPLRVFGRRREIDEFEQLGAEIVVQVTEDTFPLDDDGACALVLDLSRQSGLAVTLVLGEGGCVATRGTEPSRRGTQGKQTREQGHGPGSKHCSSFLLLWPVAAA